MNVLAIDLSTLHGQVALVRGTELLFEAVFVSDRSHNSMLYGPLEKALATARADLVVVGTGPGSYTGVRIAIAAAQGIGLALGIPVMGWSSLTTLSEAADYEVLGDARRGSAYLAKVSSGRLLELVVMPTEKVPECAVGVQRMTADAKSLEGHERVLPCLPSAQRLGRIVAELGQAEIQTLSAALLEPHYVAEAFVTKPKPKPGARLGEAGGTAR
jgi:tRNA threonylcarbamoyladenosine biosynthesis protein TsaB